ncbi:MAG: phosphatase PAP2 family protein [Caldilineaceae bacterium]
MSQQITKSNQRPPWELAIWWQSALDQWRRGWAQIPAAAWKTWLITLTIGWLVSSGIVLWAVWLMHLPLTAPLRQQERVLLQWLVSTRPMAPASANWMDIPGHPLYLVLIIAIVFFTAIRLGRLFEGVTIIAGFLLITLSVGLGWLFWARERPELVLGGAFSPGLHSFPSGHTAQATTIYGLLAYYWIRDSYRRSEKIFAFLLLVGAIIVVALGRLWVAAHWPSDVVVSLLIGTIMVTALALATQRAKAQIALAAPLKDAKGVASATLRTSRLSAPLPPERRSSVVVISQDIIE